MLPPRPSSPSAAPGRAVARAGVARGRPWLLALAAGLAAAVFGAVAYHHRAALAGVETERALAVAAEGLARAELAERTLLAERIIAELAGRAHRAADPSRLEVISLAPGADHPGRAQATLVWDPALATGLFVATDLPVVGEAQSYRLWLQPADGGASTPAGAFRPDIAGRARQVVPAQTPAVAAAAFTVTLEPAAATGGAPTGPTVLRGTRPTGP